MTSIISRSIPFKDIMRDLAEELNTEFSQDCEVFSLNLPASVGEGTIKGINFKEGIGLLMYDCLFYEEMEIQFIVNEVHPLKFMFCEQGSFLHKFQDSEKYHEVGQLQNIIVASDKNRGHIIRFKANVRTKLNNLEINRKDFNISMACEINKLKQSLKKLFQDVDGRNYFYHLGNYSLRTADAFRMINEFEGSPFQKNLLIHSQAYNIFFIQILEYWDAKAPAEKQILLRKKELELIGEASAIIDSDLSNFRSVKALSRETGLNPNKLQNGFKYLYRNTANGYVQERRLNKASILIRNTDLSFAEIADLVGIRSKSYFSKIFKDRYGRTPTEIRNKAKRSE